jgi:predicted nucleotidyltransferase
VSKKCTIFRFVKDIDCIAMLSTDEHTRLVEVFKSFPEINAVFLFGSAATGKRSRSSDIDLGIFASDSSFRDQKLDLLQALTVHGFDRVDIVLLNDADLVTQFEAVRPNVLIYKTENFDRGSVYSLIVRKYLDIKPMLNRQRIRFKQRLLDDTN